MFPMTVAITPLYILVRNLGLMNSLAGVIIPQVAFALPITVIILVPFLAAIPNELQEAAAIDGCSRLGFFWRMVIPLAVPGVITVGILAFIGSGNSYMLPLFILNNENSFTLPLGTQAFASQYSVDTAKVLAFTSLSMIPALVFFSLFERRIVGGSRVRSRAEEEVMIENEQRASARVEDLIAQMTPEEKVAQLGGYWIDQGRC